MSIYFNAIAILAAVLGGIVLLARLIQMFRNGRGMPFGTGAFLNGSALPKRLALEETCMVDGKRRLLLVRCDGQRVLLMIGGPADLVVSVLPITGAGA